MSSRDVPANVHMLSGFDPAAISQMLDVQFQTTGATIEQTGLYLNPSSGLRWRIVSEQADYVETQAGVSYAEIAAHVAHEHLREVDVLDVFALGSGTGKGETRLVEQLYKHCKDIGLFLLDVSQPLLQIAMEHAKTVLPPPLRRRAKGILGNMHHLTQGPYAELYRAVPRTKHLVTMLGYTMGNLDHEASFIKNSLVAFQKGDLLLVDVVCTYAKADDPEEIKRKDPRLTNKHPPGWDAAYEDFLSSTIFHYCRGASHVDFEQVLDNTSCTVPGSYAVVMKAHVHYYDSSVKTFNMMQYKRYDANLLISFVERLGWKASTGWFYGQNRMMYLFEKNF